jgi:multiple sugar transport system permease protein
MLSVGLSGIADRLGAWWTSMNSSAGAVYTAAPVGYTQAIIATGMLICLAPLVLLYLVAQKAFVESLSQTGIKM